MNIASEKQHDKA